MRFTSTYSEVNESGKLRTVNRLRASCRLREKTGAGREADSDTLAMMTLRMNGMELHR